ncbi:MAG: hypothetical protein PVI21_00965 [Candidatus Woesebacteria bacterium]|jgi:hypothetical protein
MQNHDPKRIPVVRSLKTLSALIGVTLLAYFAYLTYSYYNPRIDFQTYLPSSLPQGLNINSKTLEVWSAHGLDLWPTNKNIDINLGSFSIYEEKITPRLTGNNCNLAIENVTCSIQKTAKGQVYRLEKTYSANDANTIEQSRVFTDINGTRIIITAIGTSLHISDEAWSTIVDSLQPENIYDFQIKYMHPGP